MRRDGTRAELVRYGRSHFSRSIRPQPWSRAHRQGQPAAPAEARTEKGPAYRRSNRTPRVGNRAPEQHQLALRQELRTTTAAALTDRGIPDIRNGSAHQSRNSRPPQRQRAPRREQPTAVAAARTDTGTADRCSGSAHKEGNIGQPRWRGGPRRGRYRYLHERHHVAIRPRIRQGPVSRSRGRG